MNGSQSVFELAQLRCFTTVATELNFSRAAERLNMTQPPLTRQIQLLEHQLGVALFNRTTRSVVLTAAGRAFFVEAQSLLERAQIAAMTARRFAEGDMGSVTISFVPSAVYEFLPRVIAEARHKQPDIRVSLAEMNTYEQHEALRSRRVDLGIVRSPMRHSGIVTETLVREPFVLAIPRSHHLAQASTVVVNDIEGEPFIMYSHSAYQPFNELLTGMFRSAQVEPDYVQWLGSTLTILALVNAAMGLALVPKSAAKIAFHDVIFKDIELGDGIRSKLHLLWREDNDNPAFLNLLAAIRESVEARDGITSSI